jgi:queuine tRNA-ribosyltransferase
LAERREKPTHLLAAVVAGVAARAAAAKREFVVWDVGLGAASNAMAAIACFEKMLAEHGPAALRPLRIVSFERDLDPLRLALREPGKFPHIRHAAPHALVSHRRWHDASGLLHWELHHGDFLAFLESSPAPEIIFYDPFSSKTDSPLWTPAVFARLFTHCAPQSAELYTYSAATSVRVALLRAGFWVGEGVGTGPKATTTVAFSRIDPAAERHPARLLGAEWLGRWSRSHSKYPPDVTVEERLVFEQRITAHPQFACRGERG